ncbi:MAG: hypothetical protein SFY81_05150 [Verrucomicrobiota bacterium]|nr:hypothetical protein [Verrucomicrobiota bacterium]
MVIAFYSRALNHLRSRPILRAFALSLALHMALFFIVEFGRTVGFWKTSLLPRNASIAEIQKQLAKLTEAAQQQREEPQMIFVEVDPSQATREEPKEALHYSTANTMAANPIPKDGTVPRIDGSQEKVPKVLDIAKASPPRETLAPEQPQPAKPQEQPAQKNTQNSTSENISKTDPIQPGDFLEPGNKKPSFSTSKPPPKPRPRTLAQAAQQQGIIEGPKMKQQGGVRRIAIESNLDVKNSPFGAYDSAFIAAVQARWFELVDKSGTRGELGKVVVEFRLNRDGRITDMRMAESQVSETLGWLCQRAVLDPAPYAPFPADLRRMLKTDYREVRFTFHYQ